MIISILDNLSTNRERKDAILKMIDENLDPISQLKQINKDKRYRGLLKEIRSEIRSGRREIKGLDLFDKSEWTTGVKLLAIADTILLIIILINLK